MPSPALPTILRKGKKAGNADCIPCLQPVEKASQSFASADAKELNRFSDDMRVRKTPLRPQVWKTPAKRRAFYACSGLQIPRKSGSATFSTIKGVAFATPLTYSLVMTGSTIGLRLVALKR